MTGPDQGSRERDFSFERSTECPDDSSVRDPYTYGSALTDVRFGFVKHCSFSCSESCSIWDLVVCDIALGLVDEWRDGSRMNMGAIDKEVGLGHIGGRG